MRVDLASPAQASLPRSCHLCSSIPRLSSLSACVTHTKRTGIEKLPLRHIYKPSLHTHSIRKGAVHCSASPPLLQEPDRKPRLAIFVSGGGSNFRAIHAAIADGRICADVAVVVSDVPNCGGWKYAAEHGIAVEAFPASAKTLVDGKCVALSTEQLITALNEKYDVDFVLLAGYLKLIPAELVRQYKRAMLNIHPALLPNFGGKGLYGGRVHSAVIGSGARFSGPTIHFVDEGYDTGPILAQAVVPVYPTDSPKQLAARVLKEEHRLYPEAVAALVDRRITWREDGIPVLWSAH